MRAVGACVKKIVCRSTGARFSADVVRPAFESRPGQGRQQPTTGDGSRQKDSPGNPKSRRRQAWGLGRGWCAGPRCHVVVVWCRLGNNDIVALCFGGGTRVATPGAAGVMMSAWDGGGAISDKPLPYDSCEVISLPIAVSQWMDNEPTASRNGGPIANLCDQHSMESTAAQAMQAFEGKGLGAGCC